MSMRAAESRTLTAGSAFNEPVWATVLLDRRLSQATMIGIKGEGCRPGEQTHAVLLGRRTFAAPPADEGRQLKAGPLSMSHPDAVDLPVPWTPAERRADSGGRRGGRPPAVGNLAGDRCRPCLRWDREIPTAPQRLIIIDHQTRDGRRGRDFGTGIHLNEALEWSKPPGPPHLHVFELEDPQTADLGFLKHYKLTIKVNSPIMITIVESSTQHSDLLRHATTGLTCFARKERRPPPC